MPTYEFRLPDGTIIERAFKMSEVPDEIPNPNGEGTAVRIISGGAALVFKGSGFYLTDYGKNAHRTQGTPGKPAGDGGSDGASTKDGSSEKAAPAAAEGSAKSSESKTEGSSKSSEASSAKPSSSSGDSKASGGSSSAA